MVQVVVTMFFVIGMVMGMVMRVGQFVGNNCILVMSGNWLVDGHLISVVDRSRYFDLVDMDNW